MGSWLGLCWSGLRKIYGTICDGRGDSIERSSEINGYWEKQVASKQTPSLDWPRMNSKPSSKIEGSTRYTQTHHYLYICGEERPRQGAEQSRTELDVGYFHCCVA